MRTPIFQYHICHPLWMPEDEWKPCGFMFIQRPKKGVGWNRWMVKFWRFRIIF